jgi:hypothetical protein
LATDFTLRQEKAAKPVLGLDDLLLLLTYLWARETSIFPTEDQCLALVTIMLLLMYTGCWSAEMVDTQKEKAQDKAKREATGCLQEDDGDNWDSGYESMDKPGGGDPVYGNPEPWVNKSDADYDDIKIGKYLIYHKKVHLFLIYHTFFPLLSHIPYFCLALKTMAYEIE